MYFTVFYMYVSVFILSVKLAKINYFNTCIKISGNNFITYRKKKTNLVIFNAGKYFRYVVEIVPMGCLLACFQWLSWKYRMNLLMHVVFIKENLFLIQKLFILRLLYTIGSQIAFFLNFYRNLPQYQCCSIRATDIKIDK
jgi:hypothetical protein